MLCKITKVDISTFYQLTVIIFHSGKYFCKCRLALAIFTDKANFFTSLNRKINIL